MKKLILSVLLLTGLLGKASAVWVEFKNFDPVIEEILYRDIVKMSEGIVQWDRDFHYGFDKGISYDGGVSISYTKSPECFGTRTIYAQNIDRETIRIESVKIDPTCIELYPQNTNKIYAFKNAIYHEVFCHAVSEINHIEFGLCRSGLSTDKLYWGKRHRRLLKKNLFIDFKAD